MPRRSRSRRSRRRDKRRSKSRSRSRRRDDRRDSSRRKDRDRDKDSSRSRSRSRSTSFERRRPKSRENKRRSPSRKRDDRRDNNKGGGRDNTRLFAPPKHREPTGPVLTEEMKQNSVEHAGHLYASIDFTAPHQGGDPDGQKGPVKIPNGWEIAPIDDDVKEVVIKPHSFGTSMLIGEGGKAVFTAKGSRPGCMEMIWEYKKDMGMYKLHSSGALKDMAGRILIRTPCPKAPASDA